MTRRASTGQTAPAWIRDRIARHQAAWPWAVLAAGMAMVILGSLVLGMLLWTSEPVVYYARP